MNVSKYSNLSVTKGPIPTCLCADVRSKDTEWNRKVGPVCLQLWWSTGATQADFYRVEAATEEAMPGGTRPISWTGALLAQSQDNPSW